MDIQRFVLFIVFSFSLLLLWEAWQKDQRAGQVASQSQAAGSTAGVPEPSKPAAGNAVPQPAAKTAIAPPIQGVAQPGAAQKGERIQVKTDKLVAQIDTLGGEIAMLELLEHADSENKGKNVILLGPSHNYTVQSGLIGDGLPNHRTLYTASVRQYELATAEKSVVVVLEADGTGPASGSRLRKTFTFHRDSYLIDITQEVSNAGAAALSTHAYVQMTRDSKAPAGTNSMSATYTGPALYTDQEKFKKVAFGDVDSKPYSKVADNGWIGMLQHYFVVALVPDSGISREFFGRKLSEDLYASGVILPVGEVAPGTKASTKVAIYAGPQEQDNLRAIAPGLDLVVDYGWLTIIAAPLFWVLQFFHGWLGNWGLAIVFLTVTIKLIFFPLSAASYRSMAKMKLVTPRLTKIREQYADDRMKQNQAMMELYKQEKINPLGGCLPIVVQIPVFIALYWVLLASVELRQAPFYGWITDLASADPYYILPALMMVSMIIQTRMSPMPPDPVQAKVMQIMPLVFGVMFFVFPAGLVLYWLVNNVLSILQQWYITRNSKLG